MAKTEKKIKPVEKNTAPELDVINIVATNAPVEKPKSK